VTPLLDVRDLAVSISTEDGVVRAVQGISYTLEKGKTLALVGESGSGKSVSALTLIGLTRFAKNIGVTGEVVFDGHDLVVASNEFMRGLRGNEISMIFQDPLTSLHPYFRIGDQLIEAIQAHQKVTNAQARRRAAEMLEAVGIAQAVTRLEAYPHEFSGGMRQRVMIAMALVNEPRLLIADEPTTALDVTVQAQILDLIKTLQAQFHMSLIMISHDLGVVADIADDVAVMYAGCFVEFADKQTLFSAPQHPYTWGLLRSIPRLDVPRSEPLVPIPGRPPSLIKQPTGCPFHPRCGYERPLHRQVVPEFRAVVARSHHRVACHLAPEERRQIWATLSNEQPLAVSVQADGARAGANSTPKLVEVHELVKHFPLGSGVIVQRSSGAVHAVDGVSFHVLEGEALGIVGESGCGKSTVARLLARLTEPTAGAIFYRGVDITSLDERAFKPLRREIQVIFQDPYSSLSPRKTVGSIIGEPFVIHDLEPDAAARKRRVQELMDKVGLNPEHYNRLPQQFSGGQRQRIAVARAIALQPRLIIADEPVSALDVSIQAQILNLLRELQRELGLTIVFISHDLSVVRRICDRVAVMYLGQLVEVGPTDEVFHQPSHPYTAALLSAVPVPNPELAANRRRLVLAGDVPSAVEPPPGCRFHTRCPKAVAGTCDVIPPLLEQRAGSASACHFPLQADEIHAWIPLSDPELEEVRPRPALS
jgi:oligopeptide/dipeptide ABC transporter ATP-binding protein